MLRVTVCAASSCASRATRQLNRCGGIAIDAAEARVGLAEIACRHCRRRPPLHLPTLAASRSALLRHPAAWPPPEPLHPGLSLAPLPAPSAHPAWPPLLDTAMST